MSTCLAKRRVRAGSLIAAVCVATLGLAPPAAALHADASAERLQRLDAMLKVTAMRCENTGDDFQADYRTFSRVHRGDLDLAARRVRADYIHLYGVKNGVRALDRLNGVMVNQYGAGHPWLNCAQLRQVTQGLAIAVGRDPLVEAAGQLLPYRQPASAFAAH
ncbi:S-adenosyl-L-homocysteine hydrolase [Novosphingobium lindaniclasticum]